MNRLRPRYNANPVPIYLTIGSVAALAFGMPLYQRIETAWSKAAENAAPPPRGVSAKSVPASEIETAISCLKQKREKDAMEHLDRLLSAEGKRLAQGYAVSLGPVEIKRLAAVMEKRSTQLTATGATGAADNLLWYNGRLTEIAQNAPHAEETIAYLNLCAKQMKRARDIAEGRSVVSYFVMTRNVQNIEAVREREK